MKNLFILICLILYGVSACTQNNGAGKNDIYSVVDTYPIYNGGFTAFEGFLKENLNAGIGKGRVIASFVVEKDGSISNIKIIRSFSEKATAEALRVIKLMPRWKPALIKGKVVRATFTIPISFLPK